MDEPTSDDATSPAPPARSGRIDDVFERGLWSSRLLVIVGVVGSLAMALIIFWLAAVDIAYLLIDAIGYARPSVSDASRDAVRVELIIGVIKALDMLLIGALLLIFALGLYELFLKQIEVAERHPARRRILDIRTTDDLKDRIGRIILLALVIEFFQYAIKLSYDSSRDLLELAGGVLLVALALLATSFKRADTE